MNILTIPKNLIKNDDLIVLPRKVYESILRSAHLTSSKIDKDLQESILEYKMGKTAGPFKTVATLRKSLEK
ncbi:MAG: hypothetical protein AAB795_03650 [Patescibacteria group bacterium]